MEIKLVCLLVSLDSSTHSLACVIVTPTWESGDPTGKELNLLHNIHIIIGKYILAGLVHLLLISTLKGTVDTTQLREELAWEIWIPILPKLVKYLCDN